MLQHERSEIHRLEWLARIMYQTHPPVTQDVLESKSLPRYCLFSFVLSLDAEDTHLLHMVDLRLVQ